MNHVGPPVRPLCPTPEMADAGPASAPTQQTTSIAARISGAVSGAVSSLWRRTEPSVPWPHLRVANMPVGWNGTARGAARPSGSRFPCFGKACAAAGVYHNQGESCVPFKDQNFDGQASAWQHMCASCWGKRESVPDNQWPKPRQGDAPPAAVQGTAATAEPAGGVQDAISGGSTSSSPLPPEMEAAVRAAEAAMAPPPRGGGGSAAQPRPNRGAAACCTRCGATASTAQELRRALSLNSSGLQQRVRVARAPAGGGRPRTPSAPGSGGAANSEGIPRAAASQLRLRAVPQVRMLPVAFG